MVWICDSGTRREAQSNTKNPDPREVSDSALLLTPGQRACPPVETFVMNNGQCSRRLKENRPIKQWGIPEMSFRLGIILPSVYSPWDRWGWAGLVMSPGGSNDLGMGRSWVRGQGEPWKQACPGRCWTRTPEIQWNAEDQMRDWFHSGNYWGGGSREETTGAWRTPRPASATSGCGFEGDGVYEGVCCVPKHSDFLFKDGRSEKHCLNLLCIYYTFF